MLLFSNKEKECIRKDTKSMNEYLYEIKGWVQSDLPLEDEEIIYVQAYQRVHTNRKNKIKKENIYNEGICNVSAK